MLKNDQTYFKFIKSVIKVWHTLGKHQPMMNDWLGAFCLAALDKMIFWKFTGKNILFVVSWRLPFFAWAYDLPKRLDDLK